MSFGKGLKKVNNKFWGFIQKILEVKTLKITRNKGVMENPACACGVMLDNCKFLSFDTVHCFDNGYVGKNTVALKEHCVEYWFKDLQESK